MSRLYRRVESPVMTDVQLEFAFDEALAEEGKPVNRVYPKESFDLFAGQQLVVVGRYKRFGRAKVIVSGTVDGQEQKLDFPADFVERGRDETHAFIEKLWAVRRVGEILDELDLKGKNEELIKELVELSTRHGILTPYTSFLADETTRVHDLAANAARADRRLGALEQSAGQGGFAQRAYKGAMQRARQSAGGAPMDAFKTLPSAAPAGRVAAEAAPGALAEAGKELSDAAQTVRTIANRAFYRRDGQWVDSTLTDKQQAGAIRVKQFSDAYFDLARRHGRELAQYLVFDEPVVVNVENQAYLVEP